jgi:hypothetical protein
MPTDPILQRIAAADWTDAPESTVASQLIMPVLMLLGYGQHTLHKVAEQKVYKLSDPTYSKGSRRVRLDYQPRVYEEGLWVMEAKGTDAEVSPKTLGQVRDYAIHPEVRAALMVTVDRAGFRIFDPWDEHWDTPLLSVGADEVPSRIGELRAVLGVDQVADFVRRRHLDHLRRALSASLEFGVLLDAEREFRELLQDARKSIDAKRMAIYRKSREDAEELHERVLVNSGAWGVAQHHNSAWADSRASTLDLARAVLAQEERQRPTQILQVKKAIEAVFEKRCPEGTVLYRPLWWLHVIILAGSLELRNKPGCEPYAGDMARQAVRDTLLGFPDDEVAAASWRFQRTLIPLTARLASLGPLEALSAQTRSRMSAEERIRWRMDPAWFLMHGVTMGAIGRLGEIDPWSAEQLERETAAAKKVLAELPDPQGEWVGPIGDPWLATWEDVDHLQMCALDVLRADPRADDLLQGEDIQAAIMAAAESEHQILSRVGKPVAERLGLR